MHFATKGDNSLIQSYQWLAGWPSLCCSLQCCLHLESCGSKREVMAHNGSNLLFRLVCHSILQMHDVVKKRKSNDREILCLKPIIISNYHNLWICTSSESLTCFSQNWWFVGIFTERPIMNQTMMMNPCVIIFLSDRKVRDVGFFSHIEVTKPSFKISFYLSEEKCSTAQEGTEDGSSRGKEKPATPGQISVQCSVTDLAIAKTVNGKNPHFLSIIIIQSLTHLVIRYSF